MDPQSMVAFVPPPRQHANPWNLPVGEIPDDPPIGPAGPMDAPLQRLHGIVAVGGVRNGPVKRTDSDSYGYNANGEMNDSHQLYSVGAAGADDEPVQRLFTGCWKQYPDGAAGAAGAAQPGE